MTNQSTLKRDKSVSVWWTFDVIAKTYMHGCSCHVWRQQRFPLFVQAEVKSERMIVNVRVFSDSILITYHLSKYSIVLLTADHTDRYMSKSKECQHIFFLSLFLLSFFFFNLWMAGTEGVPHLFQLLIRIVKLESMVESKRKRAKEFSMDKRK